MSENSTTKKITQCLLMRLDVLFCISKHKELIKNLKYNNLKKLNTDLFDHKHSYKKYFCKILN